MSGDGKIGKLVGLDALPGVLSVSAIVSAELGKRLQAYIESSILYGDGDGAKVAAPDPRLLNHARGGSQVPWAEPVAMACCGVELEHAPAVFSWAEFKNLPGTALPKCKSCDYAVAELGTWEQNPVGHLVRYLDLSRFGRQSRTIARTHPRRLDPPESMAIADLRALIRLAEAHAEEFAELRKAEYLLDRLV